MEAFEFLIWVLVGLTSLLIITGGLFLYKVRKDVKEKKRASIKKINDALWIDWGIDDVKTG